MKKNNKLYLKFFQILITLFLFFALYFCQFLFNKKKIEFHNFQKNSQYKNMGIQISSLNFLSNNNKIKITQSELEKRILYIMNNDDENENIQKIDLKQITKEEEKLKENYKNIQNLLSFIDYCNQKYNELTKIIRNKKNQQEKIFQQINDLIKKLEKLFNYNQIINHKIKRKEYEINNKKRKFLSLGQYTFKSFELEPLKKELIELLKKQKELYIEIENLKLKLQKKQTINNILEQETKLILEEIKQQKTIINEIKSFQKQQLSNFQIILQNKMMQIYDIN